MNVEFDALPPKDSLRPGREETRINHIGEWSPDVSMTSSVRGDVQGCYMPW